MADARPARRVPEDVQPVHLGVALWLAYGIAVTSWPVIVCNAITLVLAGFVLVLKLRHR